MLCGPQYSSTAAAEHIRKLAAVLGAKNPRVDLAGREMDTSAWRAISNARGHLTVHIQSIVHLITYITVRDVALEITL